MRRASLFTVSVSLAFAGCVSIAPVDPSSGISVGGLRQACAIAPLVGNWTDPCTALASYNPSPAKAEIDLAVNPLDPMMVVVASKDLDRTASDCVWSVAQASRDGGKNWVTTYVGGRMRDRDRPREVRQFACVTDPIMVFDAKGTLFYAMQAYQTSALPHTQQTELHPVGGDVLSAFILARSTNGADSFDKYVVQAFSDGTSLYHDYPRMLVGPKTQSIHTIWNAVRNVNDSKLPAPTPAEASIWPYVVSSRDGGETVAAPVVIDRPEAPGQTQFASGFAATPDGTIYATIWESFEQNRTAMLYVSKDDARSFAKLGEMFPVTYVPRQMPNTAYRTITAVELAVNPVSGALYATWADYRAGNSDQMFSVSKDEGKTWSEPRAIPSLGAQDGHQWMGRMTTDARGRAYVAHYDRGFDPGKDLIDAVLAWTDDDGATWSAKRLTAASFDGALGIHQNGFPFIGDYIGIGTAGDRVYVGWSDTQTGVAEIAVARLDASK